MDSHGPVGVSGLASGVKAIAVGSFHACALTTAGGVKCWGYNGNGALGNDSLVDSPVPVDVVGLSSGIKAIATGQYHTCAITASDGVKCWGYNKNGQLGDGSMTDSRVPVDVSGLASGIAEVSSKFNFTCALTLAGRAKCWGFNDEGELGNVSTTTSSVPVDVVQN
jgi:alpha-tubulin suppressor-like RCC1 family protein